MMTRSCFSGIPVFKNEVQPETTYIRVQSLRMRPGNFPAIRLAQLALFIHRAAHLFSRILETENVLDIKKLFEVRANDYWHYHYTIDELSGFKKKTVGQEMTENVVINSIVPVLFAYGPHRKEKYKTKTLTWLEATAAERNAVTKGFSALQLANKTACDSQAYMELKTHYCGQKKCLQCAVGNALLKSSS